MMPLDWEKWERIRPRRNDEPYSTEASAFAHDFLGVHREFIDNIFQRSQDHMAGFTILGTIDPRSAVRQRSAG